MMDMYRLSKEQLEQIAEQVKAAVVVSMGEEGVVEKEDAIRWVDDHRIIFDARPERTTESKGSFLIKVVKIVTG